MNSRFARKTAIVTCLCGLVTMSAQWRTAFAIQNMKEGDPMPAFALPRADGVAGEVRSEQLQGKPSVLILWRPNQEFSLEALHDLETITTATFPGRIRVIAVEARRASAEEVQTALKDQRLTFPVVLDPERDLYGKIGVIVTPTTLIFDSRRILRFVVASHPRQYGQVVRARLRYLLGETDEEQMKEEIEPSVLKIEHGLASAWRLYNLGKKSQEEGKSLNAMALFEKAVAQSPSFIEARCALGFMKLTARDIAAADLHFAVALTHQPASPDARLGQAMVFARTGRPQEAEPILASLLGIKSVAVRSRYELGRIYHARGEFDKAMNLFMEALDAMFPEAKSLLSAALRPPAPLSSRNAATSPTTSTVPAPPVVRQK